MAASRVAHCKVCLNTSLRARLDAWGATCHAAHRKVCLNARLTTCLKKTRGGTYRVTHGAQLFETTPENMSKLMVDRKRPVMLDGMLDGMFDGTHG